MRRLEAPHRRPGRGFRLLEKATVVGWRAATAVVARAPQALARAIVATAVQTSYVVWPAKRRLSNANFGHVLGLPPDHPRVRRTALAAYRNYARYLVELMRLPSLPAERRADLLEPHALDEAAEIWKTSNGMIVVCGHVGSNEAVAVGIASNGWPISVVADDSSFPELFELLRRQRAEWGVQLIPWRNLREMYRVLRRKEILGLLVDWGYRPDGIPVRLFDAWTALPAGPAMLAAKTGATILPLAIRRQPNGRYLVAHDPPLTVASSEPAEIQRATQAIADAFERIVRAAPEQWYSFKPIWPETAGESAELAARAGAAAPAGVTPTSAAATPAPATGTS